MKKRFTIMIAAIIMLLTMLTLPGKVVADVVTFDASKDVTSTTHTTYTTNLTTFNCDDGSTWEAIGFQETQYTWIGPGAGGANYLETPSVSGTISSVAVTWSGNANYYLALQTTSGTELEAKSNPSSSSTETFTVSGTYSQLRLVGRRGSGTGNALAKIEKVVVTYTSSGGGGGGTTYTVTYNAHGGTGTMTDPNSPYASNAQVTVLSNAFTYAGYTFSNWNTSADGTGTDYDPSDNFNITGNVTLYAQWTEKSKYDINLLAELKKSVL